MKNIRIVYLKICQLLVVKFSIYLNRRVFVMTYYNNNNTSKIKKVRTQRHTEVNGRTCFPMTLSSHQ